MTHITKHLDDLKQRISSAALAAGRNENDVSILAVSKRHSTAAIRAAEAAGLHAMGENYLQEALGKIAEIGAETDSDIQWHFIGRIQSNKTRAIAENFAWVQTVDSMRIARRLNEQRPEQMGPLNVCVQVCVDESSAHGGIAPAETAELCRQIADLPRLRLRGLMTIPLPTNSHTEQRALFRRAYELFTELRAADLQVDTLSMGMSGDLEAAIAAGSTMIRIGTALFGARPG